MSGGFRREQQFQIDGWVRQQALFRIKAPLNHQLADADGSANRSAGPDAAGAKDSAVVGKVKDHERIVCRNPLNASRRNPYERRFRSYSHGLAPISVPENALILTSATPGKVADDGKGQYSVLVTELLNNLNSQSGAATAFNKTRISVSRASDGEQVPQVSSSLLEDVRIGG